MPKKKCLLPALLAPVLLTTRFPPRVLATLPCPNQCSGQGSCSTTLGICTCYNGFTGFDCSLRACPEGTPWTAIATSTDTARQNKVECSNVGVCDRSTGVCDCDPLFEGVSCDRLKCPERNGQVCSGRGTCTSMAEFAEAFDSVTSFSRTDYSLWDADMIHGCVCDPPFFGYDCSLTACTSGDDPGSTLTDVECNGRGTCDYESGECSCESGYSSSTTQDDCAVMDDSTIAACPEATNGRYGHGAIALSGTCSGQGFCDVADSLKSTYCQCHNGWTGYVCDERTCPTGRAWFDEASESDTAHDQAECSAAGICDRQTGQCKCRDGFEGAACERLQCPRDEMGQVCGGVGICLTMRQLAISSVDSITGEKSSIVYGTLPGNAASTTWDADKVQGCSCDGLAWEYRYSNADGAASAWTGYRCQERTCPTGDPLYNVVLQESQPEVQLIDCESTSDAAATTLTLSFRGEETQVIAGDAGVENVVSALQDLATIGAVSVSFSGSGTEICAVGGTTTSITFLSEFDSLPLITATCSGDCSSITTSVDTASTKLDVECAGGGICDTSAGECECFEGLGSSDGFAGSGLRLDCGYPLE